MGRENQEVEERIRKIKKNVAADKAAEMAQLSYVMVTLFCLIISWAYLTTPNTTHVGSTRLCFWLTLRVVFIGLS